MKRQVALRCIAALLLVTILCGAGPVWAQNPHPIPAASLAEQVERFQHQLQESGYVWQSGSQGTLDGNRGYCQGGLFSAMWANPQSPYIVSQLPEVKGQAPGIASPLTWRLRQDEAVVLIGMTPPPVAYFSFDLWMIKGSLADGPVLIVSTGDPINPGTIRATGPTSFDRPFALVVTGNRRTQAEVNKMLAASGLRGETNNVTIPAALFRLGLDQGSDEFLMPTRSAVPQPGFEKALDDYRAHPPLQVFRVRPKGNTADETQPVYPADPLPVPKLRVSGTGATELDLNPTLQLLRQRIIDSYPGYEAHDVPLARGFEEPYPGLQLNLVTKPPSGGTGGYTNDATYLLSPNFHLPDGSFIIAYGANHVVTGKAAYTSASVYADPGAAVHLESKAHTELQGSARDFIGDQPNADEFYAWTFTRAASGPQGPHVTTLPPTSTVYCAQYGTTTPVDMGTVTVLTRIYMEPETKTRPALSELLLDRVLLFTPK